jgi:hypothetical protein
MNAKISVLRCFSRKSPTNNMWTVQPSHAFILFFFIALSSLYTTAILVCSPPLIALLPPAKMASMSLWLYKRFPPGICLQALQYELAHPARVELLTS